MITIDGSEGEGGGQMIRSSLALSMITGKAFEVKNVRAKRSKPGLARQHLTCVQAAAEVCAAEVEGDQLKSLYISFKPNEIKPGDYKFQIGTAGSTSLVAQTVLPALMTADEASTVVVEGGTHNKKAPPFDFLQKAYLPIVNRIGPTITAEIHSYGFYPAGGGAIELAIEPAEQWHGIELLERGKTKPFVRGIVSDLPATIAERECETIFKKAGWKKKNNFEIVEVENPRGPGNIVMIELASPALTELFSEVGQMGVKAEQVARRTLREARRYVAADVPVGPHLADQLMLPFAISAMNGQTSVFRTMDLTLHSRTHIEIIQTFLDIKIDVKEGQDCVEIQIAPA